jgi:uncharacterized membrane protein
MKQENAMIALYDTHEEAEQAVRKLEKSGFDMKQLSIVGKDYHTSEDVIGYYNVGDRMKSWGGTGAFWGGIWGLLFGSAFFIVPVVGPLLAAGPFVAALVGVLEGAVVVGGLGVIGAALADIGIPKDSILAYETEIKAGKFMLIAHGKHDEVQKAKITLGIEENEMDSYNQALPFAFTPFVNSQNNAILNKQKK